MVTEYSPFLACVVYYYAVEVFSTGTDFTFPAWKEIVVFYVQAMEV